MELKHRNNLWWWTLASCTATFILYKIAANRDLTAKPLTACEIIKSTTVFEYEIPEGKVTFFLKRLT